MARIPKPMTKRRLRNITHHYLQQRTTTRGWLRKLLMNRARKSLFHHEGDLAEIGVWVDEVLDEMVASRLIDDRAWATSRLGSLLRKGMSERAVRAQLRYKLVPAELIDELMDAQSPDPFDSALKYARRRRIGPFRDRDREQKHDRDLGKLARAGFSFGVARAVLELEPEEALDRFLDLRSAHYSR